MIGWPVCCQRAARIRCSSRTAFVTGPTPPGTGVIAAATLSADVEVDVADDAAVDDVDADVHHERAGMKHVARDQAGRARGGDDDLRARDLRRQVHRPAVADSDRAVLAHEQQLNWLADDIAAADDHGALALERVAVELGDLDGRLSARRQKSLVAERHQPRVERMDAVDVLGGHDRVGQHAQRDVPRQWLLDDDTGDLGDRR